MKAQSIGENPYSNLICGYFQKAFPQVSKPSKTDLLDILTDIIVGNKDLRHGSVPTPEILVNIRKVIKDSIEKDLPIPILAPWGGRKTDPVAIVDVAEVSGIHQIVTTDKLIKDFYSPGLQVNMRVEDINAMWLYRNDANLLENVTKYSDAMDNLILILKGSTNLTSMRESRMMDKDEYFETAKMYSDLLFSVIVYQEAFPDAKAEDIKPYQDLVKLGWKGTIPKEQRDYYLGRYKHLYNASQEDACRMLADYFGGSKARYDLHAKGNPVTQVNGFIQANFAHPVPHAPAGLFDSTVYWRTIPTSQARTHIAPWRGKGFLRITRNEIVTKITSWTDPKVSEMVESRVLLTEGSLSAELQTDYLLED